MFRCVGVEGGKWLSVVPDRGATNPIHKECPPRPFTNEGFKARQMCNVGETLEYGLQNISGR